jgi:nucleoside-diphosphate-sugar epimerase
MRVLITGAAGFLGRKFLEYHKNNNDQVFAVDDFSNAEPVPGYPIMQADAASFLHDFDVRVELAYHFAAPVGGRLKIEGDPLFNADSLRLDSEFFRWAVKFATTAVYPSSSAVYGVDFQTGTGTALGEGLFDPGSTQWPAPDEMYGFTKMAGEVLAFKAAKYGLNTLCIRPFSGYGGSQSLQYPVPSICLRALRHEDPLIVWGAGTQMRDFIHVDDLVTATVTAVKRGVFGYETLNLGSGVPTSFISVARMAAEIMEYSPVIDTDGSKPQGVHARYADTVKMRKVYIPTITLKDGLAEVLEALAHGESRQPRQGAHH